MLMLAGGVKSFLNGVVVENAEVSAGDMGYLLGDGVFETLLAIDGECVWFEEHYGRLVNSGKVLELGMPTAGEVREACAMILKENDLCVGKARVRVTVSAGVAEVGFLRDEGRRNFVVTAVPVGEVQKVVSVVKSPVVRNERNRFCTAKTLSYGESLWALREGLVRGADEVLLANTRGEVCEAAMANVFFQIGGELWTPPLESGCLAGITREKVIVAASQEGVIVREEAIFFEDLSEVEGGFLTSSVKGIQAIGKWDGRKLGKCSWGGLEGVFFWMG